MTPDERLDLSLRRVHDVATTPDPHTRKLLRIKAGEDDPLAFGLIYLTPHLTLKESDVVSLSQFHVELLGWVETWQHRRSTKMKDHRDVFVGPRDVGKSTWCFLVAPLWAGCYEHVRFLAAFADTGGQARQHLASIRHELDTNELLRADFPAMAAPMLRHDRRVIVSDSRDMIQRANGFTMLAKGADQGMLGVKVGDLRPEVILCDDLEPGEEQYTLYQAGQRKLTLLDTILPLNAHARVGLVGTVTMPGSLIHQCVQHADGQVGDDFNNGWIDEERFTVHKVDPIIEDDNGTRRSVWPEKWPLDELEAIEGTRAYAKNFDNRPIPSSGEWWLPETFRYSNPGQYGRTFVVVDPKVSRKGKPSDFQGIAVISREPKGTKPARVWVRRALHTKAHGQQLVAILSELVHSFDAAFVAIERNQGGDLWEEVLDGLGVPLRTFWTDTGKEAHAEMVLANLYEPGHVHHCEKDATVENELMNFTRAPHDDIVDAICKGALIAVGRIRLDGDSRPKVRTGSYL